MTDQISATDSETEPVFPSSSNSSSSSSATECHGGTPLTGGFVEGSWNGPSATGLEGSARLAKLVASPLTAWPTSLQRFRTLFPEGSVSQFLHEGIQACVIELYGVRAECRAWNSEMASSICVHMWLDSTLHGYCRQMKFQAEPLFLKMLIDRGATLETFNNAVQKYAQRSPPSTRHERTMDGGHEYLIAFQGMRCVGIGDTLKTAQLEAVMSIEQQLWVKYECSGIFGAAFRPGRPRWEALAGLDIRPAVERPQPGGFADLLEFGGLAYPRHQQSAVGDLILGHYEGVICGLSSILATLWHIRHYPPYRGYVGLGPGTSQAEVDERLRGMSRLAIDRYVQALENYRQHQGDPGAVPEADDPYSHVFLANLLHEIQLPVGICSVIREGQGYRVDEVLPHNPVAPGDGDNRRIDLAILHLHPRGNYANRADVGHYLPIDFGRLAHIPAYRELPYGLVGIRSPLLPGFDWEYANASVVAARAALRGRIPNIRSHGAPGILQMGDRRVVMPPQHVLPDGGLPLAVLAQPDPPRVQRDLCPVCQEEVNAREPGRAGVMCCTSNTCHGVMHPGCLNAYRGGGHQVSNADGTAYLPCPLCRAPLRGPAGQGLPPIDSSVELLREEGLLPEAPAEPQLEVAQHVAVQVGGDGTGDVGCQMDDAVFSGDPIEICPLANAVFISTIYSPAIQCHWIQLPSRANTRMGVPVGVQLPSRCTCYFNPFRVFYPCPHLRAAGHVIVGPGGKGLPFFELIVMSKQVSFASLSHGDMVLRHHEVDKRPVWHSPGTMAGTSGYQVSNPAGSVVGIHHYGRPIGITETCTLYADRRVQQPPHDTAVAHIAHTVPHYGLACLHNRLSLLTEMEHVVQGLKGALVGVLLNILNQLTTPVQGVTAWVAGLLGLPIHSWQLSPYYLLLKSIGILTGPLGLGLLPQIYLAGLICLAFKMGVYKMVTHRLGIGGPWADLGFALFGGPEALIFIVAKKLFEPVTEPELVYGFSEVEADVVAVRPAVQQGLDLVRAYERTRAHRDPALFPAAATGLLNFAQCGQYLRRETFEELVTAASQRTAVRRCLAGAGIREPGLPRRAYCASCKTASLKEKRPRGQKSYNLCNDCRRILPSFPGRPALGELAQAVLDGVRFTGETGLVPIYSTHYDHPPDAVFWVPQGRKIITNLKYDELHHPDNCKIRKIGVGVGFLLPGWMPGHQQSGPCSIFSALLERTFRPTLPYLLNTCQYLIEETDRLAAAWGHNKVRADDPETWLATQVREPELRLAGAHYEQFGLQKTDLKIGLFDKSEWVNGSQPGLGPFGPSVRRRHLRKRGIYTPQDVAHYVVGRYARPMSRHVKANAGVDTNYFYSASAKPEELNCFLQRAVDAMEWAECFLVDVEKCETNKHAGVVRARNRFYDLSWEVKDADRDIVIAAWRNARFSCRSRGVRISGKLPPNMTLSGEDFTSLDNNLDVMVFMKSVVYATVAGRDPRNLCGLDHEAQAELWSSGKVFAAGNGDDVTLLVAKNMLTADFENRLNANANMFGYGLTIKRVTRPVDIVFLGMRPYHCADGLYRFGRLLGRALPKHHCSRQLVGNPWDWLRQVADMELRTQTHVPILSEMAATTLRLLGQRFGGPKPPKALRRQLRQVDFRWVHMIHGEGQGYSRRCIAELADVYGVAPHDIDHAINQVTSATWLPFAVSGDIWDRIVSHDSQF